MSQQNPTVLYATKPLDIDGVRFKAGDPVLTVTGPAARSLAAVLRGLASGHVSPDKPEPKRAAKEPAAAPDAR